MPVEDLYSDNCHIELNTCIDPTCALNDSTFSREKDILYAWMFYSCCNIYTYDIEAEGTIMIYSFIECICCDLKYIDVNY